MLLVKQLIIIKEFLNKGFKDNTLKIVKNDDKEIKVLNKTNNKILGVKKSENLFDSRD
jgi:hypothetical protein